MKTIKNLFFSMATLVALSVSFTSCDALADAASQEVEVEAAPINFSIGGLTAAPMQKVNGAAEVIWLDKEVDISTKLNEALAEKKFTQKNVRTLYVTGSELKLITGITQTFNLGNLKIYIDNVVIATANGLVSPTKALILFSYPTPYDIFGKLGAGKVQLKITSDEPKPSVKFDFELYNTYKSKISAFAL